MKTAASVCFLRSRRKKALTNSRLELPATLAVQRVGFSGIINRFNLLFFVAALALVWFPFIATAQSISPANLPLYFEANNDQTEFLASGNGYQFAISSSGVQMSLRETGARVAAAQMWFAGANDGAQIRGGGEMPGKVNYFVGNDSSKWQTGLSTFGKVQVTEVYPGIDLVFHGNQRQLEYDFAIAPGANPNAIKMQFQGVDKISITPNGDLVLKIGTGEIRQPMPEIYQTISGARKMIAGGYKMMGSRTVGFETAEFDHSRPLVIDPVLGYSTFFGGNLADAGYAMAIDTNNCIYIAGQTFSTKFSTVGAAQTNFGGGIYTGDAFVAKFAGSPPTNLVYLTYLGGNDDEAAYGVAADSAGNAFVTGFTDSSNFPTNNALYSKITTIRSAYFSGMYLPTAFVTELNANGTNLLYSTYLGGSNENVATSIAVDSSDNAYLAGYTYSGNFPITNAFQSHLACSNNIYLNANAFVTEIASNDTTLLYSTFLGGTNYDAAEDLALDSSNDVLVVGLTGSFNFPTTNTPANCPNAQYLSGINSHIPGNYTYDGFVTKFSPLSTKPTNLIFSIFLGGTNNDVAYGVAADASNNVYVTGWTASTNFPIIGPSPGLSSFLATNGNSGPVATNVFLTKIAPDGSAILGSTIFGGRSTDIGYKVAVDTAGDAFVVGWESSTNFPTTNSFGALLATNSTITSSYDVFVTGISANWSNALYSVCIGGNQDTFGYGIVLDSSTNVYITGRTDSTNFPAQYASQFWFNGTNFINGTNSINGTRFTGTNDAFLTEITFAPPSTVITNLEPTNQIVGFGATVLFGVSVTVTGPSGQIFYQWQKNNTNLVNGGRFSGANSPILTITNAQPSDSATNYMLTVSYPGPGSPYVESNTLMVLDIPYVSAWSTPTNVIVEEGTNVSFSVTVSGSPLVYEWGFQGTELTTNSQISDVTNNVLTINDVQTNDSGVYTAAPIIQSTGAFTNFNFFLTVAEPQSILVAPTNQTVSAGSTVSFSVVGTGFPLAYQWSNSVTATFLTNGDNIGGANSSTLTITNVQTTIAGTYTVFINNSFPPSDLILTTNFSATLTVLTDPIFTSFAPAAGGIGNGTVLSGAGGTTNGAYYVLTSSNLVTPVGQWMPVATNQFNSLGQFIFTNPVSTNTSQFFILKQP
ncbi:MAG TPA: SBBP repeat-containing protein [Verrucomicrobiae bacterium]